MDTLRCIGSQTNHSKEDTRMEKAYLIDAKHQRITTISIDTDDHRSVTEQIGGGCTLMEAAEHEGNRDCLMVDEEGWMNQKYLFGWRGNVYAGNGVLIGPPDEEGYTGSVATSELDCALAVAWPAPKGFKVSPELRDEIIADIMVMEFVPADSVESTYEPTKPSKKKGENNE